MRYFKYKIINHDIDDVDTVESFNFFSSCMCTSWWELQENEEKYKM